MSTDTLGDAEAVLSKPCGKSSISETSNDDVFQAPGSGRVSLVRGRRNQWCVVEGFRLQNDLHWAVGLMELANAGDFAANVWNQVPVPIYAVVFMAIGGTVAGILCIFAFKDAIKSWRNVQFLRHQRRTLQEERQRLVGAGSQRTPENDVLLELTTRELRMEIINRWALDVLMGGGAVLIAIGTFMAIGGAHPKVWLASNILSGYLGNAPIAIFGLMSAIWSIMVWRMMQAHRKAASVLLKGSPALPTLRRRCFDVQVFYIVNGISTILGGVFSMLTATRWWAYCVLIPVIVSSFLCNAWWRKRVGYDRPYIAMPAVMNTTVLVEALRGATQTRELLEQLQGSALSQVVPNAASLPQVLEYFVANGLFESFCLELMKEERSSASIGEPKDYNVQVDVASLSALPDSLHGLVLELAESFLQRRGPLHFRYRERFLAELLGIYLCKNADGQYQEK